MWIVSSNQEAGDGYSDILLMMEDEETGVVIEVKYAENGDLDAGCREALKQIEDKRYDIDNTGIKYVWFRPDVF